MTTAQLVLDAGSAAFIATDEMTESVKENSREKNSSDCYFSILQLIYEFVFCEKSGETDRAGTFDLRCLYENRTLIVRAADYQLDF